MAEKYTDNRSDTQGRHPVFRLRFTQFSWSNGDSTAQTAYFPANGIVKAFATVVNDNDGNRTMTVAIKDEDGYTLSSTAAIAENTTTVTTGLDVYVPSNSYIELTPSGDPGASGMTTDVTFYGI